MSRRSRLTVTFTVLMPLPAGAKPKDAEEFLRRALGEGKGLIEPDSPMKSYSFEQTTVRLTKRETVYL